MTKRNTDDGQIRIKGIGKELYKSAIKTAYEINKEKKVRLIFEVDCRNVNSIGAALKAVNTLKEEGINTRLFIPGYYEVRNYDNTLAEAPTFICEVDTMVGQGVYSQIFGIPPQVISMTLGLLDIDGVIGIELFKRYRLQFNNQVVFLPPQGI